MKKMSKAGKIYYTNNHKLIPIDPDIIDKLNPHRFALMASLNRDISLTEYINHILLHANPQQTNSTFS